MEAALAELDERERRVRADNPFWYYEPTTGTLPGDRLSFLLRWIKPEDLPQKFDGGLDFHLSEAAVRVISGGNQSSKTYSSAVDDLMLATGALPYCFDESKPKFFKWKLPAKRTAPDRKGPVHIRVVGFDWVNDVVKNLIPVYRKLAPREFLKNGSWDQSFVSGESTLYLWRDKEVIGTIEFMSNKADLASFGGPPRRRVRFDEEPLYAVYKENLMRMATSPDFEACLSFTPVNGMSWSHDQLFSRWEGGDKTIAWFQVPSVANPAADLASLEKIVGELDSYEERKMRLLGEFISLTGLVYGRLFQRAVHVIPPFDTDCNCGGVESGNHPDDCPFIKYLAFLGVDPHMVKPSVAVKAVIDRNDCFIVDTCYKKSADTEELKADLANMMRAARLDFSVFDRSADSTSTVFRHRNVFKEMTSGPNRVRKAIKSDKYPGSIAAGVDAVKRRLKINPAIGQPQFFIMDRPENQGLIKSMRTLQADSVRDIDRKGMPDKIQEGVHDEHAAMRYILQNRVRFKTYEHYALNPEPMLSDMEQMVA